MLTILLRASLEGALLAAGVWIICRALPRLSPAVRALLWWCVAAKFVVSLAWHAPIEVPVLPAERAAAPLSVRDVAVAPSASERAPNPRTGMSVAAAQTVDTPPVDAPRFPVTAALIAVWALGVGVSLLRTLGAWRETRGVVARSTPGDARLHAVVQELSAQLGVRNTADVRVSAEVESPLITGARRPVILVPAERFDALTTEQQRMALCHELAHMKRGDVWLGLVPAVVERCFFFHPLARLAAREYAFWREAACDETVIATLGASPQSYGRLLLALGVARQPATFAAAGAAWSFSNLKRRITMLGHSSTPSLTGRVLAAGAVALTMLAVAPVKAVARPADAAATVAAAVVPVPVFVPVAGDMVEASAVAPMQDRQTREERERARRAEEERARVEEMRARLQEERARIERSERTRERDTRESRTAAERVRVQRGEEERARERAEERARERADERVRERAQERDADPDQNFVYITGDEQTTMSGERGDLPRARQFRRGTEPLLWFRRDGREYIVRDRAFLREVAELWEPVSRIGSKQGEIGAKQGMIGQEQGKYGAKQGEIGARQGVIGARQGVVAAQLGVLAARETQGLSAAERREIARERETLERDMRALNREMEVMGQQMREANPPRRDLSDEMNTLGRQMSVLGEQMEAASRRANSGMKALVDRAIRSGAAEVAR